MPPSTSLVSSIVVAAKEGSHGARNQCHEANKSKPKGKGHYLQNRFGFVTPLVWPNIIMITALHLFSLYTLLIMLPLHFCKLETICFGFFCGAAVGLGVTGGAHRLWTHRSYKATLPLRILLITFYSMSGQNSMFDWVRDHRVHHKFSETDADPHNAKRGFFFSHVGWLMMKKHPEVIKKGNLIDCSDLFQDPVVVFHQKHFVALKTLLCFVIPILIPRYCWGETWYFSIAQCAVRYCISLNCTWSVNSAAHMWGNKPYDRKIKPVENLAVSLAAMGEGWHNYHHTFPWDYKAAELGRYSVNATAFWIDVWAKIGWAYDLKAPSKELIQSAVLKHGDGSHVEYSSDGQCISKED